MVINIIHHVFLAMGDKILFYLLRRRFFEGCYVILGWFIWLYDYGDRYRLECVEY